VSASDLAVAFAFRISSSFPVARRLRAVSIMRSVSGLFGFTSRAIGLGLGSQLGNQLEPFGHHSKVKMLKPVTCTRPGRETRQPARPQPDC